MKNLDLPDLKGKIILITGATNGIGKQTTEAIVQTGATVVVVGRNATKTAALVEELGTGDGFVELHAFRDAVELFTGVQFDPVAEGAVEDYTEGQFIGNVLQDEDNRTGEGGILQPERGDEKRTGFK